MQTTNSKEIVINGQSIICRELIVMQVRQWLAEADSAGIDPIGSALFEDCSLDEVKRMTDLNDDRLDQMRPSEIEQVIAVCKELNPHFFGVLARAAVALQARQ